MSTRLLAVFVLLAGIGSLVSADDKIEWRHRATQGTATLTANPLGRAERTAFYAARGFSAATIHPYAQACGFSFGMQNDGPRALTTRLTDWHAVGADGRRSTMRLPQHWDANWEQAGVPQAARIAFRWAQFQAENRFEPGDWIMGMATLETAPAAPFRLVARYHDEKGDHEIVLENLACTHD